MKKTEKVEIMLRGEFTGIDINMENQQLPVFSTGTGTYSGTYNKLEIKWPLDFNVTLKSGIGKAWELVVSVGGKVAFRKSGTFVQKRWVTLTGSYQKDLRKEKLHCPGYAL